MACIGYHGGMTRQAWLRIGIAGTVISALCCFTPVLVVLLGAVGLSVLTGVLDYVLLPALAVFVAITIYALWTRKAATSN
jgi:mercuric ion transport protein